MCFTMKQLLSFIACSLCISAFAQELIDTVNYDFFGYKGKLICVNEMHGVKTNDLVYTELVKKLSAVAKPGDTINLILEMPYSRAWLYNKSLEDGSEGPKEGYAKKFIAALKGNNIPVKIIGVDFEYDEGKRAESYLGFLNAISKVFSAAGVTVTTLNEYTASLTNKEFKQQGKDRDKLIELYEGELSKYKDNKSTVAAIKDLLFVLNAKHHLHSNRDPVIYRRLMEAATEGMISYTSRFNLLIHGAAHMTPGSNSLFDYFNDNKESPFYSNVSLIAQTYYNCSCRDYFTKPGEEPVNSSCFFSKNSDEFMDHIKAVYRFKENAASSIRNENLPLSSKLKNSILYLYIHNEVH